MIASVLQWDGGVMRGSRDHYTKKLSLPNTVIPLIADQGLKITVTKQEYSTDFEQWHIAGHFTGEALDLTPEQLAAKGWKCLTSKP